jgi:hypothetical protein
MSNSHGSHLHGLRGDFRLVVLLGWTSGLFDRCGAGIGLFDSRVSIAERVTPGISC